MVTEPEENVLCLSVESHREGLVTVKVGHKPDATWSLVQGRHSRTFKSQHENGKSLGDDL